MGHRRRFWWTRLPRRPSLADAPGGGRVPSPAEVTLPAVTAPEVSIVVPVHGNRDQTLRCLGSIAVAQVEVPYEVVVVDDGSPEGSLAGFERVGGLRLVGSSRNRGFVAACNLGASHCRGKWIVFLNNDTVVTDGWLDRLMETAESRPRTGAVGARLLFEDGRLQEAGGLVWSDGSAHNVGRGAHPDAPPYRYVRAVDYCSGACLLVPAPLFARLGGFDDAFAPAYYEDVDLAFRIRAAGLEVAYQPAATVYHAEGATAGRDPTRGVKRFQERNRGVLVGRWSTELTLQPPRGTDPLLAKDHGVVGRCLVLDQEAPTPERDAGSRRMIHMLEALVELGWKVTFSASRPMAWDDERGALVGRIGVECLTRPFEASLRGHLRRRGADYDVVVLSRPSVAARWEGVVRRRCAGASIVYDTVDLRWRRLEGEARHHGSEALRTESSRSRARELAAARRADRVIVTSPVEAEILSVELGGRVVQVVPTYYAEPAEVRGFEQREGLLFVGGFRHAPNRDAAFWLVEEILPLVRRELGAVPVRLVGEDPPEDLVRLAGPEACPGAVDDLGPWLQGARVAVAPLLWGAGLKGKVHQSLACGLPCVATSVATEGLGGRPGRELLVADDAAGLAAAIVSLYRDPSLWEAISAGGRRLVRERYGWESFRSAVSSAVGPPPAADSVPRRERKTST